MLLILSNTTAISLIFLFHFLSLFPPVSSLQSSNPLDTISLNYAMPEEGADIYDASLWWWDTIIWGYNFSLLLMLSHFSHVWLSVTPRIAVHQAPLSMGFSRQENWNGLPFPSPCSLEEREFPVTKVWTPTFWFFAWKKSTLKYSFGLNVKAKISSKDSNQLLWDSPSGDFWVFNVF